MRTKIFTALGLALLLSVGTGLALQWTVESLRAKIDFPFSIGTKVLPAGEYSFRLNESNDMFRVEGGGKEEGLVPVMSRLASDTYSTAKPRLVFDEVGGKYFLSEIWVQEADGFLISATKEKHTHKVVELMK